MANLPQFHHIHCSSRFDRSPASLETDLDTWMSESSLVTVTEVTNDARAARLREKGWGYYNAKDDQGRDADNCAIAWENATWHRLTGKITRLSNNTFDRRYGMQNIYIYSCTVVLKNVSSGHKLLVSVTHFPAHIEGPGGWNHSTGWQARKNAYMNALTNWSKHVKDLSDKMNIDAQLICADWNLNLKADWVQVLLGNHWGNEYSLVWSNFPTDGGSLHGGPAVPNDAPGKGHHDRIIDGSMTNGLSVVNHPSLMARVSSSDHRPYQESFRFDMAAGTPAKAKATAKKKHAVQVGQNASVDTPGFGDTFHGEAWWGFGDYMDDEAYFDPSKDYSTGEAGGEVL